MSVVALVRDRFEIGWYFEATGEVALSTEPTLGSYWPIDYVDGEPVYEARSPGNAHPAIVCPRCMEPVHHVTRHCVERHGDTDVQVQPARPGAVRPDWMKPDWI